MKRRRPKKFLKFMWGQQQQQKKSFFEAIQMTAKRTQMHCAKEVPPPTQKEVKDICVLTSRAPPPPQRSM
jgi:hypothetical protein